MTTIPRTTREDFVKRVQAAIASNPDGAPAQGIKLFTAGIPPSVISVILEVDVKTVRRWFLGDTVPRRADARRLASIVERAKIAVEAGALPKPEATQVELATILAKARRPATTVE